MKKGINKKIFIVATLLLMISCATGTSQVSTESYKQIDGIYKEEEGSKWIEFNNGHFSYNYKIRDHMPIFTCEKLSYGKYKVIDGKFIELNSSDSILHRPSVYVDEVRTNKGNQDSIYIEIKKSKHHRNLDYIWGSFTLNEYNFSNTNRVQAKRSDEDAIGLIWLTVKIKHLPIYHSDGRYRGLPELTVLVEMEDFNHFEIDLSPYDECTLIQEYYSGEIIRYEKNKIYWNGEIYIKR